MNTSKKSASINNGWVLCHSKSFPGKLYYFNVANGETVWSLNNDEKINQHKENSNLRKLNPRAQGYPEPTTPPDNSFDTTPTNNWPGTSASNQWSGPRPPFQNGNFPQQPPTSNPWSEYKIYPFHNGGFQQQTPIFGQSAQFVTNLGQYMPGMQNIGMPNFVWTPVQMPGWPQLSSNQNLAINQVAQTSQIERDLFIHTSGVPVSQKFVNYERPSICFNKENKIINKPKNFESSTPKKSSDSNMDIFEYQAAVASKSIPERNLEVETSSSINNIIGNSTLNTSDRSEISDYYSDPAEHHYDYNENSTLSEHNRIQFAKVQSETGESQTKDTKHLQKNDLRFLLIAKRKKLEEERNNDAVELKKIKYEECQTPPKKKVTFNLNSYEDADNYKPNTSTFKTNKSFYKIPMSPTQTTLNYYRMLENKIPMKDNIVYSADITTHNTQSQNMPTHNKIPKKDNIGYSADIPTHTQSQNPTHNMQEKQFTNCKPIHNTAQKQTTVNNVLSNTESKISGTLCATNNIVIKTHSKKTNQTASPTDMPKSMPLHNNMPFENQTLQSKDLTADYDTVSTVSIEASKSVTLKESVIEGLTDKEETIRNLWYLVVDMDVLLEDLVLIDELLEADEKCRLLIPHFIRTEVDALCIGDCRGQKRVLVARQLSRRMTTPHKQYIVEPPPYEETNGSTTSDAILKSCIRIMKNQHFVVLITNDAHLKARANANKIRCFGKEEIQNGAIVRPKLFSELKKIKVIVDNDKIDKNNTVVENQNENTGNNIPIDTYKRQLFANNKKKLTEITANNSPVNTYKKQLFANNNKTDTNCDFLVNITKAKKSQNITDGNDTSFEINNRVQVSNSNDTTINREVDNHSQFLVKNIHSKSTENQDENVCNPGNKLYSNANSLKIKNPNSKFIKTQKSPKHFQNDNADKKIVEFTQNQNNSLSISNNDDCNTSDHGNKMKKVLTPARQRLQNIVSKAINPKTSKINEKDSNKNWCSKFKIPKLPKQKETTTTALHESSTTTDQIRSNFKTPQWLENSLKKFCVKSTFMYDKITTRMEEWACTYSQIMEHVLGEILQNNSQYVNQMKVPDSNLHEMLTCIKMVYDNTKLTDIIGVLLELVENCTCSKGKFKLDIPPEDFMNMIGCGVLLVQVFKTILPDVEVLTYYESLLGSLLSSIESKSLELDPESLRPTAVCRSEITDTNKEARQNFAKNPSMIFEYLKKHYKEWGSYEENQHVEASESKKSPNGDFKVVRIFGKNMNMLKIDNNKSFSYNKTAKDNNSTSKAEAETKLIRLLGDNQPNSDPIEGKRAGAPSRRVSLKQQNIFTKEIKSKMNESETENAKYTAETKAPTNTEPKIIRFIDNTNQYKKDIDEESGNTFVKIGEETIGPKVVRNFKMIDEQEKKIKYKEPLDLDILDFSEIQDKPDEEMFGKCYENDEYINSEETIKVNEDNITKIINNINNGNGNDNNGNGNDKKEPDPKNIIFNYYTRSKAKKDIDARNNPKINKENDIIIEKNHDDSAILNDINTTRNSIDDITNNLNNDNECLMKENKEKYSVNKDNDTMNPSRDDSTNDSGFENESSQAYSLLQVFLIELSTTLKSIYKFIFDFVKEMREGVRSEERKNLLYSKSSQCLQAVRALIQQLKSIIERESYEDTALKTLLFRSGMEEASKDPKMTQYRDVIKRCLGQAEILQNALNIIVCATIGDLEVMSHSADSINSSIKYFI